MKRAVSLVMVVILMIVPAVNATIIDDSAEFISKYSQSTEDIRKTSFSLIALSTINPDTKKDYTPQIELLARFLIENQNPDGGWGLYLGEPSNVLDTAYAMIALKRFISTTESRHSTKALMAIKKGIKYITSANTGTAWGYIPGSSPSCYPSLVAIWALGENGYTIQRSIIRKALNYLEGVKNCEISSNERLALELIARYYVKAPADNETIENAKFIISQGELTTKERAMLTYALTLYDPFDFNTIKSVNTLIEQSAQTLDNLTYWISVPNTFGNTELITTSAYSIMAISVLYKKPTELQSFEETIPELCNVLSSTQNPDGGWGLTNTDESKVITTYYALNALSTCYPKGSHVVQQGLLFMKKTVNSERNNVITRKRLTFPYYYAVKTLLKFDELDETEKREITNSILSARLKSGLWGSTVLGPQPLDTAIAIDLLIDLGMDPTEEIIQNSIKWLLNISKGGWGTYIQTRYVGYMLKPNTFTTSLVLKVLRKMIEEDKLRTHVKWLESQRVDGGWAYFKYDEDILGEKISQKPDPFITAEVTVVLREYNIDYTKETAKLLHEKLPEIKENNLYLASTVLIFKETQPIVSLENVVSSMNSENFMVFIDSDQFNNSQIIYYLRKLFNNKFTETSIIYPEGNYIIIARLGNINITQYNPYIKIRISDKEVTIENFTVPMENTVILVPGKMARGMVLLVVYFKGAESIVMDIFTTGFIKYLQGDAMILTKQDGKVNVFVVG